MSPFLLLQRSLPRIHDFFQQRNISECRTPKLQQSGSLEPFLDPLCISGEAGVLGYLPTSPEFALKKALNAYPASEPGIYEISPSFRDETLSFEHNYEFTMVEFYLRNEHYLRLFNIVCKLIHTLSWALPHAKKLSRRLVSFQRYSKEQTAITPQAHWNFEEFERAYLNESQSQSGPEAFSRVWQESLSNLPAGLIAIFGFPIWVRGMSQLNKAGWARRIEFYLNGIEVANGYQELSDPIELENLWLENNRIRRKYDKNEHPVLTDVIKASESLGNTAGLALGLERILMALYDIPHIQEFQL